MVKLKKNSKILLLLVAIISLFGFSMIFASDEPGKITISKSATKDYDDAGDDNLKKGRNAKVTLTVNGNPYTTSQTSMSKLDIILVLDNSGSMAYGSRGKNDNSTPSRIASLESTANDFINTMLDKDGNVQIGLVTFSKDVNTSVSFSNYSKKNDLTTAINGMTANGGTNLQAGIEKAHDLLDGGRNDAKKMVIILTDGIPTYFNTNKQVWGRSIKITCGDGTDDKASKWDTSGSYLCPDKTPSAAAEQELDDLKKDYSTADIYTITFGEEEEAASKLEKINPVEANENHTYKNEKALDANQLKKLFENISQSLKNVLATNSVVTDTIPSDFSLTDTAKKDLESKEVEVTENEDGTTTLKWNIGDISAKNELSLTYEVRAKEEYHGSMYTNTKAVLTAKASDDNPFYENKDLSLEFEEPSVEIPAITKDDHYKDNSSYKGYSGGTINGTSILNNDLNKHIERESKEDVSVTDKIVIVENNNVKRIVDNKYEIYKDSSLQGTLTINEDGTFTFNSSVDTIGEVSFDYYIESDITNPHETKDVESNTSTVTLLINERQKMSINGKKIWKDDNNNDGLRPESVNVNLYADNEVIRTIDVAKSSDWKYSFNDLYVYRVGHENEESEKIVYRVAETQIYNGYSSSVDGYNITNKHEIEKTEVSGTKTWEDKDNQDGKRPKSITIHLLANGEEIKSQEVKPDESGNWKYSFTNLDKYSKGKEIAYTVKEDEVTGYEATINGNNITNKHEIEKTEVSGTKTWDDNKNQDGKRPESITINLLANGKKVSSTTATAASNWKYSFTGLNKYENGKEISYTVKEDKVEGYTSTIDHYNITNKHQIEKAEVSGTKTWNDNNNQDGKRPEKITVRLYANGEKVDSKEVTAENNWSYSFNNLDKYKNGKEITYTVKEDKVENYNTKINGYDITNTHTPQTIDINGKKIWNDSNNQDGKRPSSVTIQLYADGEKVEGQTATISGEGNNWNYSFKNLPMYKAGEIGHEIKYSVQEVNVDSNYSVQYDKENKFNIINTHDNIKTEVSGTKTWDDNNNQDGKRPEKITVRLYANGVEKQAKEVKSGSDGKWNYSFTGLDKYSEGKEITYTVSEDNVEGYKTEISGNNITNIHNPEKISITGTKTWNDNNNQDGIRPDSITINLLANGEKVSSTIANSESNWNYSFTNLDKYNQGTEIKYALEEVLVDGYTSEITDFNITNTHTPETVSYILQKAWSDQDNNDAIRPEYIIVHLYADGYEKLSQKVTAESGWTYTFEDLPKYNNGKLINYTFTEDVVKGYNSSIVINDNANNNQSTDRDKIIDNNQNDSNKSENTKNVTITNTHENEKNDITITKKWNDSDNIYNKRPDSIKVTIVGKVNGQIIVQKDIEITKNMDWLYITKDLDKYYKGQEIKYEIIEDEVGDYTTTYDGYNIINTYIKPAIGETSGEITPPNTGVETSNNNSLIIMLLILVSSFRFVLIKD